MIDRNRGSPALQKFFTEAFAGTLVNDLWVQYESIETDDRRYCLVHLLRKRPDFEPKRYESRIRLIDRRLTAIIRWQDPDGEHVYRDADALRTPSKPANYHHYPTRSLQTAELLRPIYLNRSCINTSGPTRDVLSRCMGMAWLIRAAPRPA